MSVGLLREKLAPKEVAAVTKLHDEGGAAALLQFALENDERAAMDERGIAMLSAAIDADPSQRASIVEAHLRATVTDPKQLAADLKELRRGRANRLNVAALAERSARRVFRWELASEIALAMLRDKLTDQDMHRLRVADVVRLAVRPGRWSRRVEALSVIRQMTRYVLHEADRDLITNACVELAQPAQHRWVQTPALEVLSRVSAMKCFEMMRGRLAEPLGGDDFLVRERLVELAARLRRPMWHEILELAADDPSEHVRITAARVERHAIRLTHASTSATSEKVRATALLALAKRRGKESVPTLLGAVEEDASPLVVTTAAAALTLLAKRKAMPQRKVAQAILHKAAQREDLPLYARAALLEELLAVSVLADPYLRLVYDLLEKVLADVPVGGAVRVVGKVVNAITDEQMGQVLSALARDDFSVSADRVRDGFMVYRGERRTFAIWRWIYELLHPLPSKRQGYSHTWSRAMRGRLRAPPAGLAELTATSVPGERLLIGKRHDWGRHLPLVEDLLQSGLFSKEPTRIVGAQGTTIITPPRAFGKRLAAAARLSLQYARFDERRRRSLDSDEEGIQRGFLEVVARETGIRMDYVPHGFTVGLKVPPELAPSVQPTVRVRDRPSLGPGGVGAFLVAPFLQGFDSVVRDFLHYAVRPEGNRLPHVGAYAAAVMIAMLARGVATRRGIDKDRKAMPLVIGGWGTRGKSGTERLKAGLFQGRGYEVLVKTTGCEAMFIHAMPGVLAHEVFLYRPYDKATIWEQRGVLALGKRLGVRVFLWECMALQPDLVNLLTAQWMRDDYSTITNAYPDHEDVQGPAGYDVAEVISEFIPPNGRLFTTEDQMLPILREMTKTKNTSIRAIGERESMLIGDDVLARFPYHEHPKNIALVSALAQALGVPAAVALAEMADHVVPDLGVLKTYPRVAHDGRTLAFTNGMSANERTGALGNWTRMHFDEHDVDREPARWIVTVVNNRADRVARSEVFARFVVQDIGAHKHFLIGTNVSGLVGFMKDALEKHLVAIAPTRDLAGDSSARHQLVLTRLRKAFLNLKLADPSVVSVDLELAELRLPRLDPGLVAAALAPSSPDEALSAGRRAVDAMVPNDYPAEARPFVVDALAKRRIKRAIIAAVDEYLPSDPRRVDKVFADAYRALFQEQVVPLFDPALTGDQIIDLIAKHAPPGARVDVMGLQNIKGTGLDFVYRWVSLEAVERALAKTRSMNAEEVDAGLRALLVHDDYGLVDSAHAMAELSPRAGSPAVDAVLARLGPIVAKKRAALSAKRSRSAGDIVRGIIGKTFDYLDSMRRQSMAREVVDDLVAGRISHASAAVEMRNVVARAKGAWATKKAT